MKRNFELVEFILKAVQDSDQVSPLVYAAKESAEWPQNIAAIAVDATNGELTYHLRLMQERGFVRCSAPPRIVGRECGASDNIAVPHSSLFVLGRARLR